MGEVYKARDTRLERTVAIKVLRAQSSERPDLRQRFEREARAISALNHPHICTLHDIGQECAIDYLVMECLEGETLADRLNRGALPVDHIVRISTEVAGALDRAHHQGIIHCDLKPGNIMLTKDGAKVLDFGLARFARVSLGPAESAETQTAQRAIVGTLAYMAPEQLAGKESDARTDIFALGIILYEMLTGRRPFGGGTQAGLIAEIMRADMPDLPNAPPQFAHVVARCLTKDPAERWQSASDVNLELQWAGACAASPAVSAPPFRTWRSLGMVTALACLALGVAGSVAWLRRGDPEQPVYRFSLAPPPGADFLNVPNRNGLALSPDGRWLVFLAIRNSQSRLWVQRLDSPTAHELPGTENASTPFWSPDGRSLAFFAGGSLRRIDSDGSNLQSLAADIRAPRGGSWGSPSTILFSPGNTLGAAIYRLPAGGGTAVPVTTVNLPHAVRYHAYPVLLDDGEHFLYRAVGGDMWEAGVSSGWYLGSLHNLTSGTLVLPANTNVAVARPHGKGSRYLLWNRGDTVVAQKWTSLPLLPPATPCHLPGQWAIVKQTLPPQTPVCSFTVAARPACNYSGWTAPEVR